MAAARIVASPRPAPGRGRRAIDAAASIARMLGVICGAGFALAACSTLERSRDVGNPAVPGKTLALQVCSNCHGVDGNSTSPNFPRLAAQPEPYLVLQLKSFRGHDRRDPAGFEYMWGLSRKLTDAQIAGIASYFHDQAATSNPAGGGPEAAAGKAIFQAGLPEQHVPACASCHGTHGEGHDQFPRLAGQHADYVRKQLLVFQRTEERPEGAVMKVVAHELRPSQIVAVADYVQGIGTR
jgi:cytochrome c553